MKISHCLLAALATCLFGCNGIEWFPESDHTSTTPAAFSFAAKTGVKQGETVTSDAVTITGIPSGSSTVRVAGDSSSALSINNGTFTNISSTVKNNDQLKVRHTASSNLGTTVKTTVTIGGFSTDFISTTASFALSPTAFDPVVNVKTNTVVTSGEITITSVNPLINISLSNPLLTSSDAFSVNGGEWNFSRVGTIQSGDRIALRHTSAPAVNSSVVTTLIIDGQAGPSFMSTTSATGL